MAKANVFVSADDVLVRNVEVVYPYVWDTERKRGNPQKNILNIHSAFKALFPDRNVLEVSTKSGSPLGRSCSPFNLMCLLRDGRRRNVESLYQSAKVFEDGTQYAELADVSAFSAKTDKRLKTGKRIMSFRLDGQDFPTEPKTLFYNFLYVKAMSQNKEIGDRLMAYDAFTDCMFSPKYGEINCQARACALYVSLRKRKLLDVALESVETFWKTVYESVRERDKKENVMQDLFEI